ncbi:MAG: hypothetical protein AABX54_04775 [Nanoarchaeota archaeon]
MRIYPREHFIMGRIPREDDFKPALAEFEEDCVFPFLGREVVGSFAYGSVNRGDCNVASDIDYFMLISDERHKKKIRDASLNAFSRRDIFVQARVIHVDHARNGLHRIDDSFRQHLGFTVSKYGYRGENPLEILSRSKIPFRDALQVSMGLYLMKLNNGFCSAPFSELDYLDFLKDIMEKPWHAMRVSIQHALGNVAPEGDRDFEDTKEQLVRVYKSLGYDRQLLEDIEKIKVVASEYIRLLLKRRGGVIDTQDADRCYSDFLPRIEQCYDSAYHFVDANARIIANNH